MARSSIDARIQRVAAERASILAERERELAKADEQLRALKREQREQERADDERRALLLGLHLLKTRETHPDRFAELVRELGGRLTRRDDRDLFGFPRTTASDLARIRRALLVGRAIVTAAKRGERSHLDAAVARVRATTKAAATLALVDDDAIAAALNDDALPSTPAELAALRRRTARFAALLGDRVATDADDGERSALDAVLTRAGRSITARDRARVKTTAPVQLRNQDAA